MASSQKANSSPKTTPYGTHYWTTPDQPETENLSGDNSQIIMDRVIPFINKAKAQKKPFFTTIWFHTPHLPVVADSSLREMYDDHSVVEQLYGGTITAMDTQVGRLSRYLNEMGEAENTIIWFASDNGPEVQTPGSAGPFRERKRSLFEGGIRVPAFSIWPAKWATQRRIQVPAVTSDYLPTLLDLLSIPLPDSLLLDGKSLVANISDSNTLRHKPIGFLHHSRQAWVTDTYKLISLDKGETYALYNLIDDPEEKQDLSATHPEIVDALKIQFTDWKESL